MYLIFLLLSRILKGSVTLTKIAQIYKIELVHIYPFSFCLYLSNLQFHCKSALLTSTHLEILANIINLTLPISYLPITKSPIALKQASMKTVIISQQFMCLKFIETKDCYVLLTIFHTYPNWFRVRFMHFAKNALVPLVTVIYAFPLFDATEL